MIIVKSTGCWQSEVFSLRKRVDLQNRLVTYTVFGLYYLGLILGAVYAAGHRGEQNNYFWYYIESFLQNHNGGSFLPVFSVSFLSVLGLQSAAFDLQLFLPGRAVYPYAGR